MLTNLVADSEFKYPHKSWMLDNAKVKGTNPLQITSSKDTFGIHQKLYLQHKGRYYFRVNISALKYVKEAIIGVEIDGTLRATKYYVNVNTTKALSVIVDVKDTSKSVTLYLICVSKVKGASISIARPVLYNLDELWLKFALKLYLDFKLKYYPSLSYDNLYTSATLTPRNINYAPQADTKILLANTGEIVVSTRSGINIKRKGFLQHNHKYLLKLLKEEVNHQGDVKLIYNGKEGKVLSEHQQYLIFRFDGESYPYIQCKCKLNSKIDYKVILKKVLLINVDERKLSEEEIKTLLYLE